MAHFLWIRTVNKMLFLILSHQITPLLTKIQTSNDVKKNQTRARIRQHSNIVLVMGDTYHSNLILLPVPGDRIIVVFFKKIGFYFVNIFLRRVIRTRTYCSKVKAHLCQREERNISINYYGLVLKTLNY